MFTGTTQEVRQDNCSTDYTVIQRNGNAGYHLVAGFFIHKRNYVSSQEGTVDNTARGCWHDNMDTCDDITDHFYDELEHI